MIQVLIRSVSFVLQATEIVGIVAAGGIEVLLNISMVNPSIVTVEMGDMEFQVMYENAVLGTIGASAVTVVPGKISF